MHTQSPLSFVTSSEKDSYNFLSIYICLPLWFRDGICIHLLLTMATVHSWMISNTCVQSKLAREPLGLAGCLYLLPSLLLVFKGISFIYFAFPSFIFQKAKLSRMTRKRYQEHFVSNRKSLKLHLHFLLSALVTFLWELINVQTLILHYKYV